MAIDGNAFQSSKPICGLYKASPSTLADGEQDTLRVDSSGRLVVNVGTGGTVGNVGGDVAHDAADANSPVKIGGKGSAAVAAAVTEGDRVNASFTLEGRLRTTGEGTIAHDAADGGNPLKIGGKGNAAAPAAVTEGDRVDASFTLEGRLRTLPTGDVAHGAADAGAPIKVAATATAAAAAAVDEGDRVQLSATLAGRLRVTEDLGTAGDVAHDSADSGNPVKVGSKAISTLPTALTANDRSNLISDLYGRLRVVQSQPPETWYASHAPAANTQATISKAAGSAAERHVCRGFLVSIASDGAPTPEVLSFQIRDGATGAGTIMYQGKLSLAAVSGASAQFGQTGLYLVGSAATAMTIEFNVAGGANDTECVSMYGETIPA